MADIYIISSDAAYDHALDAAGFGGCVEKNGVMLFDYAELYLDQIRAEDAELLAARMGVRKLLHRLRASGTRIQRDDRVIVETDHALVCCLAAGRLPRKMTVRQCVIATEWRRWQTCFALSACKTASHSDLESMAHRRAHALANQALVRARQLRQRWA